MEKNQLSAKIPGYLMTNYKHGNNFTKYNIEITQDGKSWYSKKTYPEFRVLHKKLKKSAGNIPLPKLPKKGLFDVVKTGEIDSRKKKLSAYVKELIKLDHFYKDVHFIKFFELQSEASALKLNSLKLVGYKTNKAVAYREAIMDEKAGMFFGIGTETPGEGFIEKTIAGAMHGEGKKGRKEVLRAGDVEAWMMADNDKIDDLEYMWTRKLKTKARCMDWCEELQMLAVGCESGFVSVLKLDEEDEEGDNVVPYFSRLVHDKKAKEVTGMIKKNDVVGVYLDPTKNLLYSVAEDKFLKTVDLGSLEIKDCKLWKS